MECQSHAGTAKELSRLQEQVHRLERLFPGRQEDGLTSVARAFFELEAREAALQQSETEIWGRAKDLAMLCGDIQHEYAQRRRDTTRSVAANQAELIRQQLRYPPQYPPQTTGRG